MDEAVGQRQKLLNYYGGFYATWVVYLGRQTGLFAALAEHAEGLTVEALAAAAAVDLRYTAMWCRAARAFELLEEAGGRYHLARGLAPLLLVPDDPRYFPPDSHVLISRQAFRLPEVMRAGGRIPQPEHGPELIAAIGRATRAEYEVLIREAIPSLPDLYTRLTAGCAVLEIGPGAGQGLVKLARAFPASRFTGADAHAIPVEQARAAAATAGLADRIAVEQTPGEALPYTAAFDVVLSHITLHEVADPPRVIAEARRALRPGGGFLVSEYRGPETPEDDRSAVGRFFLGADLLYELPLGAPKGFLSSRELQQLLVAAGFREIREAQVSNPFLTVLYARG